MEWAKNWVTDKLAGYAATGIQAGGNLAGNAVGGVGSLIENSGRSIGQSANGIAGAVSGVGNYINGYGEAVKNSMAADGPVGGSGYGSGAKKTAVQPPPTSAVKRTANGTAKSVAPVKKSVPSPNTNTNTNSHTPKALPAGSLPPKLPAATNRALPAKKPTPATAAITKAPPPPSKPVPSKPPLPSIKTAPRPPPISTAQSERTPDGKIKISPLSRPHAVKATPTTTTTTTTTTTNGASVRPTGVSAAPGASRPLPARAPVPMGQSRKSSGGGKVRISPESRPRAVGVGS